MQARLDYQRAWHDVHPDYSREAGRKRRIEHPEDLTYYSQWRRDNAEAVRAYVARRRGQAVLGMSAEDKAESIAWRKLIADDPCHYCGTTTAESYEDDHYVSIANGGTDHWWNIVRACWWCNRSKGAMNGDEFSSLHRQMPSDQAQDVARYVGMGSRM